MEFRQPGGEIIMNTIFPNIWTSDLTMYMGVLTTKIKMRGVEEPIHLLAIVENVSVEEIDGFDSFSSDKGNKSRVTKTSPNMERRKLEAIIPQKMI
ncbi:hypothetical protein PVK06_047164 [Gossypium arboreum]|uniref:Uncharacterized protein n=1 Tax=Gossypium arboreum TaxID=29729 RepID=A0ABR0MCX9_GOSAR|nr:hypothetical protein PVK06_047164 [Gossypium arboreum]